jgi:phospholipase D
MNVSKIYNIVVLALMISMIIIGSLIYYQGPRENTITSTKVLTITSYLTQETKIRTSTFTLSPNMADIETYFSHDTDIMAIINKEIKKANSTINIMIYSLTYWPIAESLIIANEKGIKIRILFESDNIDQWSMYDLLKRSGIECRKDSNQTLLHDKIMILDNSIVITGSANYTNAAKTTNNENIVIIRDRQISNSYQKEFNRIWAISS